MMKELFRQGQSILLAKLFLQHKLYLNLKVQILRQLKQIKKRKYSKVSILLQQQIMFLLVLNAMDLQDLLINLLQT